MKRAESKKVVPPSAFIHRAPPVTDLRILVADFWPEDETADDINDFVARQRAEDKMLERGILEDDS